jgi:hypothetical protein
MPALARAWLSRFKEELFGFGVAIDWQTKHEDAVSGKPGHDPFVFAHRPGTFERGELSALEVSNHKGLCASKTADVSIWQR